MDNPPEVWKQPNIKNYMYTVSREKKNQGNPEGKKTNEFVV